MNRNIVLSQWMERREGEATSQEQRGGCYVLPCATMIGVIIIAIAIALFMEDEGASWRLEKRMEERAVKWYHSIFAGGRRPLFHQQTARSTACFVMPT